MEDFYAAIGYGEVSASQIAFKHAVQEEQPKVAEPISPTVSAPLGIKVLGTGELLTRLGKCCKPVPGDDITGYITRSAGVTIHRTNCPNIVHEKERERLVTVQWGQVDQLYPIVARIDAWDRLGLLRDITAVVSGEGVNISSIKSDLHDDNSISIFVTLETKGLSQLSRLLSKLERVGGVTSVTRGFEGN